MAMGALSSLVPSPVSGRAGAMEGQAEARRSDLAAWLSGLSLAGLGRPGGARPVWEREATASPGPGFAWSTTAATPRAGRPRRPS